MRHDASDPVLTAAFDRGLSVLGGRREPLTLEADGGKLRRVDDVVIEGDVLDPVTHMDRLERLIDRLEEINEQIVALNGQKRLLYAAAKETGFDVAAIRGAIKRRESFAAGRNPVEKEAMATAYLAALGEPLPLTASEAVRALAAKVITPATKASAQRRARIDRQFMMMENV